MSQATLSRPAIEGGTPVRQSLLSFATPQIDEGAIAEVVDTLRSGWLTTGKKTEEFERRFADYVGNRSAVGLTSGTAALALALEVNGVGPGDEVITSPTAWVSSAHEILHRGAVPIFVDIDRTTFNIDPESIERRISEVTKAILPVHFAGRPCEMNRLAAIAERHRLALISDSAHAIEAEYENRKLATWFPINAFSFHPIKNLTTGEGGMITTDNVEWAHSLRQLRLHGVTKEAWNRHNEYSLGPLDVLDLGYKCNMTDLQSSLGLHQLESLEQRHGIRERLWSLYDDAFSEMDGIGLPAETPEHCRHALHRYNVVLDLDRLRVHRDKFCVALLRENIGTGQHYRSLHTTTYYKRRFGLRDDDYPNSLWLSERIVSLPLHAAMTKDDAQSVVDAVSKLWEYYRK
jgi:dTDP-4-amino-4,6-dideoxygalactose transaminase